MMINKAMLVSMKPVCVIIKYKKENEQRSHCKDISRHTQNITIVQKKCN